jgi:TPR repeat protein
MRAKSFILLLMTCLAIGIALPILAVAQTTQPSDAKLSLAELRQQAEQGDAEARYNFGRRYDEAEGVEQDFAESAKWYRKAAEQGYAKAQFSHGVMYAKGEGVEEDDAEAVKWYRKAADQGDAFAQYNLGVIYENGEGVSKNLVLAYAWFDIAAASGNADARKHRNRLENQISRQQIAEAKKISAAFKPKVKQADK